MSAPPSPTLSDSALLDSLADDPRFDLSSEREKRMEEIKEQAEKVRAMREREAVYTAAAGATGASEPGAGGPSGIGGVSAGDDGYGRVITFRDEKSLLMRMAKEKYCLIHFFHPDFARCRIMDEKLDQLAPKYPNTLFARAAVADVPFSVTKFGVQVLPDVHVFVDGRCVDRLIGFEDLGPSAGGAGAGAGVGSDNFTLGALEWRLSQSGALVKGKMTLKGALRDKGIDMEEGSDGERSDGEEERSTGQGQGGGRRKGRVGIRNGLFNDRDEDEWD